MQDSAHQKRRGAHKKKKEQVATGVYTSKKDKLYDGNNAINQRVTSILALYDDITGLPSYNDMRNIAIIR